MQTAEVELTARRTGGVTLLRFTRADLLDEEVVGAIRQQVLDLLEGEGPGRFVLDFGGVRTMSCSMLGTLLTFHKQVRQAGGELTLCSLAPGVSQMFEATKLHTLFRICPDRQAASQAVPAAPG